MEYCSIECLYSKFIVCTGINTDSRRIEKNCMFFAIRGDKFDGNVFALSALHDGASFAVVDDESLYDKDERILLVKDTTIALQELARYHRQKIGVPVIAITGTNGKTTTKELITAVLSSTYNVLSTYGNLNNHIGVPLTLLKLNESHQIAVIEMGANHIGDIKELVNIALPNYGIITNIGIAHIQGFGSLDGVVATKCELYEYLKINDGVVFVNGDDSLLCNMSKDIKRVLYSQKQNCFTYGEPLESENMLASIMFSSKEEKAMIEIKSNLVGRCNIYNILASVCIGQFFSVKDADIKESIERYVPTNNRSQLIVKGSNTIISDAYNANPTSMKEAIENFSSIKTDKKKILMLGDMNELGDISIAEHKKIVDMAEKILPDAEKIYCGTIFSSILPYNGNVFGSYVELSDFINSMKIENSIILIKGSNSIKLYDIKDLF